MRKGALLLAVVAIVVLGLWAKSALFAEPAVPGAGPGVAVDAPRATTGVANADDAPAPPERRPVPADEGSALAGHGAGIWVFHTTFADGRPAPDVPLAVWQSRDAYHRTPIFTGRTDASGVLRAPELPGRAKPEAEFGSRFAVIVRVPAPRPVAAVLDVLAPPPGPVELVLPPVAPVAVELVDAHDVPVPLTADLWVGARHAEPGGLLDERVPEFGDRVQRRRQAGAGPVHFGLVATGGMIGVSYRLAGVSGEAAPSSVTVDAPWRPGPAASAGTTPETIRVRLDERFAVATGRVLGEGGKPASAHSFLIRSNLPTLPPIVWTAVGRFALLLHRDVHDCAFDLQLRPEAPAQSARNFAQWAVPEPPWGEVFDIGDARLSTGELALAGRLVDGDGTPIPHAQVWLAGSEHSDPDDSRAWRSLPIPDTHTDADGRFELRTGSRAAFVRARIGPIHGHLPSSDVYPFATQGIEIAIEGEDTGDVEATFRVDRATSLEPIAATLEPSDGSMRRQYPQTLRGRPPKVHFAAVKAGTYRLDVVWNLEPAMPPLATVDGIVVRAGSRADDPRLQDIPLAGDVMRFAIQLVDEHGQPLREANGLVLIDAPEADASWSVFARDGSIAFAAPVPRVTARVVVPGRRARTAVVSSGESTIALDPAPIVDVALPEVRRALGKGFAARIGLLTPELRPPTRAHVGRAKHGSSFYAPIVLLDDQGHVAVSVAVSGEHRLELFVPGRKSIPLGTADIDADVPAVRSIDLRDGWRADVEALRSAERR